MCIDLRFDSHFAGYRIYLRRKQFCKILRRLARRLIFILYLKYIYLSYGALQGAIRSCRIDSSYRIALSGDGRSVRSGSKLNEGGQQSRSQIVVKRCGLLSTASLGRQNKGYSLLYDYMHVELIKKSYPFLLMPLLT